MSALAHLLAQPIIKPSGGRIVKMANINAPVDLGEPRSHHKFERVKNVDWKSDKDRVLKYLLDNGPTRKVQIATDLLMSLARVKHAAHALRKSGILEYRAERGLGYWSVTE